MKTPILGLVTCFVGLGALIGFADDRSEGASPSPVVVSTCDHAPLFAYGSWEGRISQAEGVWRIAGEGVNGQGGCGERCDLDLSTNADAVLRLRLRGLPGNRTRSLRILLRDADGTAAIFRFEMRDGISGDWQDLSPVDGLGVGEGEISDESLGKDGKLDLAQIVQWQILGEWKSDLLAIAVDRVSVESADEAVRGQRAVLATRLEEEAARARKALAEARAMIVRSPQSPRVARLSCIAADVLSVEVEAGTVLHAALRRYEAEPGDERKDEVKNADLRNETRQVKLVREGKEIGWLIGPKRDWLVPYEGFEGEPLPDLLADAPDACMIVSPDDPGFATPQMPLRVYRKSKPTDWQMPGNAFAMHHTLYYVLPRPFKEGCCYTVSFPGLNTREKSLEYAQDTRRTRSEAVHGSQIGFRPDDPCKRAFLSVWLGTGGAYAHPTGMSFHIVDETTGQNVFSGKSEMAKRVDETEAMRYEMNWNKTTVQRLDFSALNRPGRYRVVVEGVGCGYPFEIGPQVWEKAFVVQMRGFYNNRSGMALGSPVSNFERPRALHPADGHIAYQSTWAWCDGEYDNAKLAEHSTGQPVPEAWGGYHDAGDWNPRRVTHLRATLQLLELLDLFPEYFRTLAWRLPARAPKVPDILNECLFELDLFRRLQRPDGAVSFGIETEGDPIEGEASWLQSMPQYVWAPDCGASFYYAIAAARAARLLAPYDAPLAETYRASASRAFAWGEGDLKRRTAAGQETGPLRDARGYRTFAMLELYRLTKDPAWHVRYAEATALRTPELLPFEKGGMTLQDEVFAYACLPDADADAALKRTAVEATVREAERSLEYARGNAFNLTHWHRSMPMFIGFYSVPGAQQLVRAHALTHKREYLQGAVQAALFSSGANPNNMTYTSGVGAKPPRNVLNLDARHTGQGSPEGITVYGNCDYTHFADNGFFSWPVKWFLSRECRPSAWDWPIPEAYFDIFRFAGQNEPTMDQSMGPNAYIWGYLAARPEMPD